MSVVVKWPERDALIAEITAYILHANAKCNCTSFGACQVAGGKITEAWEERVKQEKTETVAQ